ncbi:MAG: hypothetical protein E7255_15635 [Lachnospiraceae bacterium]|jgi:hypothetical protein|nr:hypothetical protein [Lachnospiraceae bacterium]
MSLRRRNQEKKRRKTVELEMEDVLPFVENISICSGALMFFSVFAFLLTGRGKETDVVYAMVIGMNAFVFVAGMLFVRRNHDKD